MYAPKELGQWTVGRGADRCRNMRFAALEPLFASVCADRSRGQEFEDRFVRGRGLIGRKQMAGAFEQDELCAGNARRDQFPVADRDQPVDLPVNYEG